MSKPFPEFCIWGYKSNYTDAITFTERPQSLSGDKTKEHYCSVYRFKREIVKYGKLIEERLPVRVNWMKPHYRKLRAGQLLGNRFSINITGLSMDPGEALERAKAIARTLGRMGIPNFYGPQRVDYENVRRGNEIIKGRYRVRDRWLRRFLVTSYLNYLCNLYLVKRLENGDFHRLLRGDIAKKQSTGGLFVVDDPNFEEIRYKTGEISFTAPIFSIFTPSHTLFRLSFSKTYRITSLVASSP